MPSPSLLLLSTLSAVSLATYQQPWTSLLPKWKSGSVTLNAPPVKMKYEAGSLIWVSAPQAVLFPRKHLNLKFAKLLMRSAYEAMEALNCTPMDTFQKNFWKFRQREIEAYTRECQPLKIKYGDLSDPLYFDFISYALFATVFNELRNGKSLSRDGQLLDKLRNHFQDKAGTLIYSHMLNGFEEETFKAHLPCSSTLSFPSLVDGVSYFLQSFVDLGYALKASVVDIQPSSNSNGGKFRVKVEGGATLWGVGKLASMRSSFLNNFDAFAIDVFLRASMRNSSYKILYRNTYVEEEWDVI